MSKGEGSYTREYTKPVNDANTSPFASLKDECLGLSFTTSLQFIDTNSLGKVCLNEVLPLRLQRRINRVEMINAHQEVCGAVVNKELAQLIDCINKGHTFNAKVLKLSDSSCTILVQNANR